MDIEELEGEWRSPQRQRIGHWKQSQCRPSLGYASIILPIDQNTKQAIRTWRLDGWTLHAAAVIHALELQVVLIVELEMGCWPVCRWHETASHKDSQHTVYRVTLSKANLVLRCTRAVSIGPSGESTGPFWEDELDQSGRRTRMAAKTTPS